MDVVEVLEFLTFLTSAYEFETECIKIFGRSINVIGASSVYYVVMMIADAIRETGLTDTFKLQKYINSMKEFNGASLHLVSDGKGTFIRDFAVRKIVYGKIIPITV